MAGKKIIQSYASWPRPAWSLVVKTNKTFRNNYNAAIMYAHYELSSSELKREALKYVKSLDPGHPLLDRMKNMHENRLASIGKYMYVLNHGGDVPDNIMQGLLPGLEKVIEEEETKILQRLSTAEKEVIKAAECDAVARPVITIQDRLKEKTREVAGEVEGWIDDFFISKKTATPKTVEEFVTLFKTNELKAPHARIMASIFERRYEEISLAYSGKDKELSEAYSNFTKVELKRFMTFHSNLLSACAMLQEVAKVERAPRKKKPVSQEKLVAKLKYKKEDSALGIVSASPVQIIGSKEVWVYNTKTRKIAQYKALDERGILVKGASLENYSSDSAEKTVRKPAETLAAFKKASKVKLRTFLQELSTVDIPAQGKLNEHHVILRIDNDRRGYS